MNKNIINANPNLKIEIKFKSIYRTNIMQFQVILYFKHKLFQKKKFQNDLFIN